MELSTVDFIEDDSELYKFFKLHRDVYLILRKFNMKSLMKSIGVKIRKRIQALSLSAL